MLNESTWSNRFHQLYDELEKRNKKNEINPLPATGELKERSAKAWHRLIARLDKRELDEDTGNCLLDIGALQYSLESIETRFREIVEQEQVYQNEQDTLKQSKQAVSQAILAEKQLESQREKYRSLADTWRTRAAMAVEQKNVDLADQALQRQKVYEQSARDVDDQLKRQRQSTASFREEWVRLEREVQKLIVMDKAGTAAARAKEMISVHMSAIQAYLSMLDESEA